MIIMLFFLVFISATAGFVAGWVCASCKRRKAVCGTGVFPGEKAGEESPFNYPLKVLPGKEERQPEPIKWVNLK